MSGRRVVIREPYAVTCEEYEVGRPGSGQVIVETEASAISPGTELAIYTGIHQWLSDPSRAWPRFPCVPGYSAVGRVLEVGEGVHSYRPGARLIWDGRHASHALVDVASPGALVYPISEHVPARAAALAALARFPLTAVVRAGEVLGQSVAVLGLGLIGQLALRLFSAAGAYPLFGLDPVPFRRRMAERVPGARALDPGRPGVLDGLREINSGERPDVVVDATGNPDAVRQAMALVADGGRVIMVGSPRGIASEVDFYHDLHGRSISLVGAHGSALGVAPREKFPFVRERAMRLLIHLLESDRLGADELVTHHVRATELREMYEGLLHDKEHFLGVTLHW